jgi:hypothetical protein
MIVRNTADIRADCEGHRYIVVERRLIPYLTETAAVVIVQAPQAAEALHDTATLRAKQRPIHPEQAERCGMKEEVDDLLLGCIPAGSEGERIDPKQRVVVASPNVAFEF